jgi:hypothetical protein
MLDRPASLRDRMAMYNANTLKIGVFGANCSSGRCATTLPERWSASWPDCLRLARMADAAGIDFMLPIGRWKGYGGATDMQGTTLETITWATGLLAATERITVFGTVHAPTMSAKAASASTSSPAGTKANLRCSASRSASTMPATTMRRSGSTSSNAPGPSRTRSMSTASS